MTTRAVELHYRNVEALRIWRAKMTRRPRFLAPDAWKSYQRTYLEHSQRRKLEAARSFLDRLRFMRATTARTMGVTRGG